MQTRIQADQMRIQADVMAGLSSVEAKARLSSVGYNTLKKGKRINPVAILLSQFTDLLTIILLMSTGLSFLLGERTEAITIISIVVVNALLGFFQEYRTEKTIEALKNMAAPHSRVLRDGAVVTIATSEIVPGDVVFVEAGDRVPADCELLDAFSLHADESLLTGESIAVEKQVKRKGTAACLFMGTIVTQGHAKALVTATGMETEMGRIAGMLGEIEEPQTPLQKRLNQLGRVIAIGCLLICAIVSLTGILRGENTMDMIMMGISLSVAAVPEGLAAIVTISLALAVGRMVRRKALIRKLHAVETLGCSSIICTDKTGTLTENRMTVRAVHTVEQAYEVTGGGQESHGSFLANGRAVNPRMDGVLSLALTAACVCNNAALSQDGATGDPTEIALLVAGQKAGVLDGEAFRSHRKVGELPFDSDRKRMTVTAMARGEMNAYTKGASDVLVQRCTMAYTKNGAVPMTAALRMQILRENERLAASALRVLAVAYRPNAPAGGKGLEENLTFLALIGMLDPPRKASYDAVRVCKQAGVKPVMITGDHLITARAVAEDLSIFTNGDQVLTGDQIDKMSDGELAAAAERTTVFARVSPRHKLQIVRAFKRRGHVVAMTGDGVNDAPAIKEADIGVSMGISGTDVAKEAAGVILLDDNFATLVAAVEEGRIIYKNIRKFIRYLLSCNVGEVLTMFVGMLLGLPVVLLPIQILWINLVTDGLPAIALGLDPPDGDEMRDAPRGADDGVFSGGLMRRIITRGCAISFCTLLVFILFLRAGDTLEAARTGAFMTLVLTQLIHVFECKSEKRTLFRINLLNNRWLLMAVTVSLLMMFSAVYLPMLQPVFHTVTLGGGQILTVLLVSLLGPIASGLIGRRETRG